MPDQPIFSQAVNQELEIVKVTAVETAKQLMNGDISAIKGLIEGYIFPACFVILVVIVGYLVAKYFARIVSSPICKRVDETLGKFMGRVTFYGILLSVIGAILNKFGVVLTGVATTLAAFSFAVGLAFQGSLSNCAAGILLLVFRPFKVGDVVTAAGMTGKVDEIDLFTTTLDTADNRRIIVPNSSISAGTIENTSFHRHRRIEICVGVAYSASLDATRAALTVAAQSLRPQMIEGSDRGYDVILATLADSSVQWKVRVWVLSSDFRSLTERLTEAIKSQLDLSKISIPFPQMDVHLHREAAAELSANPPRVRPRLSTSARESRRDAA